MTVEHRAGRFVAKLAMAAIVAAGAVAAESPDPVASLASTTVVVADEPSNTLVELRGDATIVGGQVETVEPAAIVLRRIPDSDPEEVAGYIFVGHPDGSVTWSGFGSTEPGNDEMPSGLWELHALSQFASRFTLNLEGDLPAHLQIDGIPASEALYEPVSNQLPVPIAEGAGLTTEPIMYSHGRQFNSSKPSLTLYLAHLDIAAHASTQFTLCVYLEHPTLPYPYLPSCPDPADSSEVSANLHGVIVNGRLSYIASLTSASELEGFGFGMYVSSRSLPDGWSNHVAHIDFRSETINQ